MAKYKDPEFHEDCTHKRVEPCLNWQGYWWNLCVGCGDMTLTISEHMLELLTQERELNLDRVDVYPDFDKSTRGNYYLLNTRLQDI